jgi:hypothetical protein
LIDAVFIAVLARHQIPASALPSDLPLPTVVDPPSYFHAIASWDGQWYRRIVEHGYPSHLPMQDGEVQQNAWAFYPGYPWLVWLVTRTGASFGVAASVVSLSTGAGAMCVLYRMIVLRSGEFLAALTVLALCCAPAAPIFQAAYTESLGLLLLLLGLWCLERRHYGWLVAAGLALALSRPVTLPLALAAGVQWLALWHKRRATPFPNGERWALGTATGVLAVAAGLWPLIAGVVVGDFSAYAETQRAWRGIAGNRPDTWFLTLVHGASMTRWVFVVLLVALFAAIAFRNRRWALGTRVWVMIYPVFILAATPATSSIFRYMLLAGPAWWPAPRAASASWPRRAVIVAAVASVGLASQVWWLDWYFVITPSSRGTP